MATPSNGCIGGLGASLYYVRDTIKDLSTGKQEIILDWLNVTYSNLQKTICSNSRLRQLCENDSTDEVIAFELSRQIITHTAAPENLALLLAYSS